MKLDGYTPTSIRHLADRAYTYVESLVSVFHPEAWSLQLLASVKEGPFW